MKKLEFATEAERLAYQRGYNAGRQRLEEEKRLLRLDLADTRSRLDECRRQLQERGKA